MVLSAIFKFIASSIFDVEFKNPKAKRNRSHILVLQPEEDKTAEADAGADDKNTTIPVEPIDPDMMGSNINNPIKRDIKLKLPADEELSPGEVAFNMCTWLINVYLAAFCFWIPAFFGDFEAYFYYIRE